MNRFNPYARTPQHLYPPTHGVDMHTRYMPLMHQDPNYGLKTCKPYQSGGVVAFVPKAVPVAEPVTADVIIVIEDEIDEEVLNDMKNIQKVIELNNKIHTLESKLDKIGVEYGDPALPPHIPTRYMGRDNYKKELDRLALEADNAQDAFSEINAGTRPLSSPKYLTAIYNRNAVNLLSPEDYNASIDFWKKHMKFACFLEDYTSVECLDTFKQEILLMVEKIFFAKLDLRALQHNGVDIGVAVFRSG